MNHWLHWLPGLQTLRRYEAAWVWRDIFAGVVLATMLVPVGIAYAAASGLPGIHGLYATIVPLLIELSDRDHPSIVHAFGVVLKQIVLNPLIMSACFGAAVAALHIELPVALDRTITFLQNAAAPTALFVLGVTVALRPFDRVPWEVPGVIAVKLLIHPLAAFGLMLAFGPFAQPWAATAVLIAALPPALNVFVIARQNNTWIEPASVAVLIGTFASVVTLTSVMWFIQTGRLVFP